MNARASVKARINQAFQHVLGSNIKWVFPIFVLISWFSDLLLTLLTDQIIPFIAELFLEPEDYKNVPLDSITGVLLLAVVSLILFFLYRKGIRNYSYEDLFNILDGTEKNQKNILIFVLSPYKPYDIRKDLISEESVAVPPEKTGYETLEIFKNNIGNIQEDHSVSDLRTTRFQSNWLPPLRALEEYKDISDVIVITTDGTLGSFDQFSVFSKFLKTKFGDRNISVHKYDEYIKNRDIGDRCSKGLPSNNFKLFQKAVLHIIHNIDAEDGNNCTNVVADVTGGISYMTAVLSAASVKNGIELHYTDLNDFTSHNLDISAH